MFQFKSWDVAAGRVRHFLQVSVARQYLWRTLRGDHIAPSYLVGAPGSGPPRPRSGQVRATFFVPSATWPWPGAAAKPWERPVTGNAQ